MRLNSIWSALEESSEILGDNYAYPAMDKIAEELALPPDFFIWVAAIWLFGGAVHHRSIHADISIRTFTGE